MYKAGGPYARKDSEKIIKIVASEKEKDCFIAGAMATIIDERYNRFKNHVINDWKEYTPYTDEEKEYYKNEQPYILRLYESDFENVVVFWFYLSSYFA